MLIGHFTGQHLEGFRHHDMNGVASLTQERCVRHLTRQRVLEGVFARRIQRCLVEKLALHQPPQAIAQRVGRQPGNTVEHRFRRLLPDHRRRLQQTLGVFDEAVDACRQEALPETKPVTPFSA